MQFATAAKERSGYTCDTFSQGAVVLCEPLFTNHRKRSDGRLVMITLPVVLIIAEGLQHGSSSGRFQGIASADKRNNLYLLRGIYHVEQKNFLATAHGDNRATIVRSPAWHVSATPSWRETSGRFHRRKAPVGIYLTALPSPRSRGFQTLPINGTRSFCSSPAFHSID
jgi:hypothetical protein